MHVLIYANSRFDEVVPYRDSLSLPPSRLTHLNQSLSLSRMLFSLSFTDCPSRCTGFDTSEVLLLGLLQYSATYGYVPFHLHVWSLPLPSPKLVFFFSGCGCKDSSLQTHPPGRRQSISETRFEWRFRGDWESAVVLPKLCHGVHWPSW